MMEKREPLLEMQDINVFYGDMHALKGVDFNLFKGEIHALTGEHRAGKSTLIKILSGAVQPRSGSIFIKGKKVGPFTPKTAMRHRIGTVYQTPSIIPDRTLGVYLYPSVSHIPWPDNPQENGASPESFDGEIQSLIRSAYKN